MYDTDSSSTPNYFSPKRSPVARENRTRYRYFLPQEMTINALLMMWLSPIKRMWNVRFERVSSVYEGFFAQGTLHHFVVPPETKIGRTFAYYGKKQRMGCFRGNTAKTGDVQETSPLGLEGTRYKCTSNSVEKFVLGGRGLNPTSYYYFC